MSPLTVIVILLLGVLLFGGKLPEMARDLGKGLLEFQKGMNEWGSEAKKTIFEDSPVKATEEDPMPAPKPQTQETSAPKFEPPAD
jgi:Sec-independent protein secretion pathway components